jgi:predicted O-methyltransferase YrrM
MNRSGPSDMASGDPAAGPGKDCSALDAAAMERLLSLCEADLPWSDWSMRPAAITRILSELRMRRHGTVIELGSGVSTIYIAAQLRRTSGRVRVVEHDAGWARVVEDGLEASGLGGHAELITAPLEPCELALDETTWYAPGALADMLDDRIDALIVDGPPGGTDRPLSRYPALPFFIEVLSPSALIILDDLERPGEREVLNRWESEFELRFERLTHLRIAMASRAGPPIHP